MTIKELHAALSILLPEQGMEDIAVGHDQIWCGKFDPRLLAEADKQKLLDMGFFEDEESWARFV